MLLSEVSRYQDYFGEEPLELAVIVLGLAGGCWMAIRGSHPARVIVLGLLFAAAFFVVAVSTKSKYYMLLTYPLYLLLLTSVLERLATWIASKAPQPAGPPLPREGVGGQDSLSLWERVAVRGIVLTVLVLAIMVWPMKLDERAWDNYIQARRYREGQEYLLLTSQLSDLAGAGATVLAPPVYWIGMHDHPFVDIYVYERVERQYGMTPAEFLDEIRPDIVITDAKIATERRVERSLYNELDARARYELIVRHKNYGDVAVYRLSWPARTP
jgi:hypothetical protein